jgi:hypothetical protein
MDKYNFARAWARAAKWNTTGLPDLAYAEVPALSVLWAVQLKLYDYGIPIGDIPRGEVLP